MVLVGRSSTARGTVFNVRPFYFRYKVICSTLLENIIFLENGINQHLSPGKKNAKKKNP